VSEVLKNAARLSELAPEVVAEALAAGELELSPALELVERYRGVADTVRRAEQHMTRAVAAIAPFSEGQAKEDLLAAARFAVGRDR
jgi:geranylgeranyl pyrophosphate synthase